MTGLYFIKQNEHEGCIKKEHVPSMERTARKIEGDVFPGFPLKAMSHADIICCAFTEIWARDQEWSRVCPFTGKDFLERRL
jgi:hypothetical protein